MPGVKRKRPGRDFDADEKLLHQVTKAITKEVRQVKAFLLHRAVRKRKSGQQPVDAGAPPPTEIAVIKALQPEAAVKRCLRRLGLAHTGADGLDAGGDTAGRAAFEDEKAALRSVLEHKRMVAAMEALNEKVTQRRREKLAEAEKAGAKREKAAARAAAKRARQVKPRTAATGSAAATPATGAGELHASWEAKRALKTREAAAVGAFCGRKTTFADSDDEG